MSSKTSPPTILTKLHPPKKHPKSKLNLARPNTSPPKIPLAPPTPARANPPHAPLVRSTASPLGSTAAGISRLSDELRLVSPVNVSARNTQRRSGVGPSHARVSMRVKARRSAASKAPPARPNRSSVLGTTHRARLRHHAAANTVTTKSSRGVGQRFRPPSPLMPCPKISLERPNRSRAGRPATRPTESGTHHQLPTQRGRHCRIPAAFSYLAPTLAVPCHPQPTNPARRCASCLSSPGPPSRR
jgi:hypothetical protein